MKFRVLLPTVLVALTFVPTDAWAFEFEKLVMPGPVSALHADVEADCASCHRPLGGEASQDPLCATCHEDVAQDQADQTGLHGRDPRVRGSRCRDCHTEHQGRAADILGFDASNFRHRFTDFDLEGQHRAVACGDCHGEGEPYRAAGSDCADCHGEDDPHRGRLGEDCASCHESEGWRAAQFDHSKTDFALEGEHQGVACGLCHVGERYEGTPTDCRACHATNDVHRGEFGRDCARCHAPKQWDSSVFDHGKETNFALTHRHARVDCRACHTGPLEKQKLDDRCIACHATDDVHRGSHGRDCASCHSERSWKKVSFDHAKETDFPLHGKHAEASCQQCHRTDPKKEELSTECAACHLDDDAHAGSQGDDCGRCHGDAGWRKQVRFDHDITRFPLLGLHAVEACESCHESTKFRDVGRECSVCHAKADPHDRKLGTDCERCHNPNSWAAWRFDHGVQTDFPLAGAHEGLNCLSCHTRPVDGSVRQGSECATCHDFDDVHSGAFGRDCARCHSDSTWSGATVDR